MKQELRDSLAAEYVLGTLSGRARERFRRLLKYDAGLRRSVAEWEARLAPLAETTPEVSPPARVWRAIEARIRPQRSRPTPRLAFWRGLALASSALALVMAIYTTLAPRPEPAPYAIAVMNDKTGQPMLAVTWPKTEKSRLKLQIHGVHVVEPGKSWELWMLPEGGKSPVSIGLITDALTQTVELSDAAASALGAASGLAVSLEPKGGSPTGQPTGPVLCHGPLLKI
jgi:anti-sigma-K factor RskA